MELLFIGGSPTSIELLEKILLQNETGGNVRYEKREKLNDHSIVLYYKEPMGITLKDVRLMMKSFEDIYVLHAKTDKATLMKNDKMEEFAVAD